MKDRIKYLDLIITILISLFIFAYFRSFNIHNIIGIILFIIGLIIWLKALFDLGDSFSVKPKSKRLIQRGIYSKLRHPIYYGAILSFIGLSIYSLNLIVTLFTIFLIIKQELRIKQEENILAKKFKKRYIDYKKETWF